MGIFNRHPRHEPTAAQPATTSKKRGLWGRRQHDHVHEQYSMASRPTFGQWLKYTWLDLTTMVIMGIIGLGVYEAHPAANRSFAVTFVDGEVVYPEFAYPLRKEIIPIFAAAMLAALVPILIILIMQIRVRSFWDVNNGVIGLLYSLITAAVFQVFLKWLIGGLRPHFLTVCQPDFSLASNSPGAVGAGLNGVGYKNIYYTREICTGDINEIDDSLESFPSGHTTAAFAGFVYLSLYLNAKLKVFANYHPAMWKLVLTYAPILGATLIGGALTIDEYHNWYDVFAGAVIGTVMAFSSYRMVYASIWDWRFNHIPLHRGQACMYSEGMELSDALWTRKGGWGMAGGSAMGHQHGHKHGHHGHGVGNGHHTNGHHTNGHHTNGYHEGVDSGPGFTRKPVGAGHVARGDDMV